MIRNSSERCPGGVRNALAPEPFIALPPSGLKGRWLAYAVLFTFVAGTLFRAVQWIYSPEVPLLVGERGAQWILRREPFSLVGHKTELRASIFRRKFVLSRDVAAASMTFWANKTFGVDEVNGQTTCVGMLDGATFPLGSENLQQWKSGRTVSFPHLRAGWHELLIAAVNVDGPACLLAHSSELNLRTDDTWEAGVVGAAWAPARLASSAEQAEICELYPTVAESARRLSLPLLLILVVSCAASYAAPLVHRTFARSWGAKEVRIFLLVAWAVLSLNNIAKMPAKHGFDINGHLMYIDYLLTNRSLPLATDGWQMFQSPLFYVLEALIYAVFSPWLSAENAWKVLEILPMLCGALQIEVMYRVSRLMFPDDSREQSVALLVGAMLPINVYMSQYIGNEPLTGLLTSLLILQCLRLIQQPPAARSRWFFASLGGLWGLAILAKVTPFLLAPLVFFVAGYGGLRARSTWRFAAESTALAFTSCSIVCGWWFLRNWILLGKPFVAGWDPARGISWWQDPGFRTWTQVTTFGAALVKPVYSASYGLGDGLYSSLWLDGMLGGMVLEPPQVHWNLDWMQVGAGLGLLPSVLILLGIGGIFRGATAARRASLFFLIAALLIYAFAMLDLFMRLPIYSTAKASYLLGLLPCFGVLAANGYGMTAASPVMQKAILAGLFTWATVVYLAYFCTA